MKLKIRLLASLLMTLTGAVPAQSANTSANDHSLRDRIERYTTDLAAVERSESVSISQKRSDRLRRFYEEQLRELGSVNFGALEQDGRVDYVLFRNKLRHELHELEHERQRVTEVGRLLPFADALVQLEEARRRMEPVNGEAAAKILTTVTEQISRTRRELEKQLKAEPATNAPAAARIIANRAARLMDDLRQTLRRWNEFSAGYHPEFTWWVGEPYQKADKELKDYADFLRKKLAGFADGEDEPVLGDPIGRAALLEALQFEMIPYTPEELIDIANQEFAWCEKEQRRAARDLGFGDDWHKALDHVSNLHVKPGDQPQLIKQLADEAVKFLEARDLVTIPALCQETWRMEMMPPDRQKVNPYFTGGEVISVSYPTASMSTEDISRRRALRSDSVLVTATTLKSPGTRTPAMRQAARKADT